MAASVALIDDDQLLITTLKKILEIGGYQVEAYLSHEAFTTKCDLSKINLVIVDYYLETTLGTDIINSVKASHPNIKTILSTAKEINVKSSHIDLIIPKPWNIKSLLEQINTLLQEKKAQQ